MVQNQNGHSYVDTLGFLYSSLKIKEKKNYFISIMKLEGKTILYQNNKDAISLEIKLIENNSKNIIIIKNLKILSVKLCY